MIKFFITKYKRVIIFGDMEMMENGFIRRYAGKILKVKILNLFWITYRKYYL